MLVILLQWEFLHPRKKHFYLREATWLNHEWNLGFLHPAKMHSECCCKSFHGRCDQDTCTSLCVLPYKPYNWVLAPSHVRHKLLSSLSVPSMSCLWLTFVCDDPASIISLCFLLPLFETQYLMSGPCCKYVHKWPITSLQVLVPTVPLHETAIFFLKSVTFANQSKILHCFSSISLYFFTLYCLSLRSQMLEMCILVLLCVWVSP